MVSSVFVVDTQVEWKWDHHRICSESAFIKQDIRIWTTRMDFNCISTGYSNTDVYQESLFIQKKYSDMKCCIRSDDILFLLQTRRVPSTYSASIIYLYVSPNLNNFPLKSEE